MAEGPEQHRVSRPRPAWEDRLDAIDGRLESLTAQMSQVIDALAAERDQRRSQPSQTDLGRDLGVLADRVSDTALDSAVNREVLQRLDATVSELASRLGAVSASLAEAIGRLDEVDGSVRNLAAAPASSDPAVLGEVADRVASIERRLASRSDLDALRQRIEEAEVSLSHNTTVVADTLRGRIDDQRAQMNEIGAQLANLTATSAGAVDLPDKVRREIHKEIEELAEHLGLAMSDLRVHLVEGTAPALPALTSGLDRISGRIEADAQRLSKVVSAAQATNEERMRRLDTQVSELRQRLELLRLSQPLGSKQRAEPSRPRVAAADTRADPATQRTEPVGGGTPPVSRRGERSRRG